MNYLDTEKNFFGRRDELQLLKRRVIALKEGYRQNVALLGAPFVGKSSLLKNFLLNIDDPELVAVYLDLENKDFEYYFSKFSSSLLYGYAKVSGLPLHENLSLLIESTRTQLPHTVAVIQRIQKDFQNNKHAAAYLGLLTLPEVFTNETGKFCVLIFDEFQVIEDFNLPDAFLDLGKKIMTQKKCFYILSSSYPQNAQKIIAERLSLLFGNFENITIEPFDLQTCQNFIQHSLIGVKMGATLRNFLTDFTGGHPLYLNLICKESIHLSAVHRQQEAYMPIVSQAVENTLFDRWGVISRHFELIVMDLCPSKGNKII
jgi:AAA+ ATPase superfamily predicted ATPase